MNKLEKYILDQKLDANKAMDTLQDKGLVSDNAITAGDVSDGDCDRAIEQLKLLDK